MDSKAAISHFVQVEDHPTNADVVLGYPWSPKIRRRSGPSYPGRLFCATMQSVCWLARS